MNWGIIGLCVLTVIAVFMIYRIIKTNPYNSLSRESLMKAFSSMGFLALMLIAFVGILVLLLR